MSPLVIAGALLGGALGAAIRYLVARALPVRPGHLPWGVLIVNVAGSAVAGAVLGLAERASVSPEWMFVIVSGFCGGLTTFSTWMLETVELADGRRWRAATLNVLLTLALGVGAAACAYLLLR